jgi:hypothetical protein
VKRAACFRASPWLPAATSACMYDLATRDENRSSEASCRHQSADSDDISVRCCVNGQSLKDDQCTAC